MAFLDFWVLNWRFLLLSWWMCWTDVFCVELTGFGVKRSGHIVMNLVGVELRQTRLGLIYSTLSWTTFDSKAWLIEPGVGPIRIDNP